MCNACGFLCCASDMFERCGCDCEEQACWDITGKSLGVPVYKLLGGRVRDKVRMYTHLGMGQMKAVYETSTVEPLIERAHMVEAEPAVIARPVKAGLLRAGSAKFAGRETSRAGSRGVAWAARDFIPGAGPAASPKVSCGLAVGLMRLVPVFRGARVDL